MNTQQTNATMHTRHWHIHNLWVGKGDRAFDHSHCAASARVKEHEGW